MKNVKILIKSSQYVYEEDEESVELITDGEYSCEDGVWQFSYMESELTGFAGTKTTFLGERDCVTLSREGAVVTAMVFCEGRKHHFLYETPEGSMTMGINTHKIKSHMDENGGELEVEYNVEFENSFLSRNSFRVSIEQMEDGIW